MTIPVKGKITSKFDEPRPLSNPGIHPHGSVDIENVIGTPIRALEPGKVFYALIYRREWENEIQIKRPTWKVRNFPWANYFYDTFGGLIILQGRSGLVHIFAHSYGNQIFNKASAPCSGWEYKEETDDHRWPTKMFHTLNHPHRVIEGETIGYLGNAGYSTGPHVHWEIHHGWQLDDYQDRVDPESLHFSN